MVVNERDVRSQEDDVGMEAARERFRMLSLEYLNRDVYGLEEVRARLLGSIAANGADTTI